jgi:hypothetical protein
LKSFKDSSHKSQSLDNLVHFTRNSENRFVTVCNSERQTDGRTIKSLLG